MPTASQARAVLRAAGNPKRVGALATFHKAGPGEYAEGDRFFCIPVPVQRGIARQFRDLPLDETLKLLRDPYHECRLTALFIMIDQFRRSDFGHRALLVETYLGNLRHVNHWDLVDTSAAHLLGAWLGGEKDRDRSVLYELAKTGHLWSQRVAVVATHHFIRKNAYSDALALAEILLHHAHDLIHKAVGWTLREVGNREVKLLIGFLADHYLTMPRTALRYAIEKLDRETRTGYLKGTI